MERTPSSSSRRAPIITLRMHEVHEELAAAKRAASGGGRPVTPTRGREALVRGVSFCRFFCTCCTGACCSMAPPMLAAAELLCIALVYLLAIPNAWPTRSRTLAYSFSGSAGDVVLLSVLRCAAVVLAHAAGAGARLQRPYLLTGLSFAAVSLPLGLMKLAVLRHSGWPHRQWPPFIALYCAHMGFAVAQALTAQRVAEWARARHEHGLHGYGFPWREGEAAWLLAGQLEGMAEEGRAAAAAAGEEGEGGGDDVPAEQLAEPDSRWALCGGLRVHYKLALPLGQRSLGDTALVLVHSFGGGAFAWRHVQQPLADATGLPVLAFDRPGFGLTDRPAVDPRAPKEANPYALKSQALLLLELAGGLGLQRVVLAGHGDGALLALLAAAMACREAALGSPPRSPGGSSAAGSDTAPRAAGIPVGEPTGTAAVPVHARRGSLPESLDWAWMSSVPEGQSGSTILQRLLRGDWPASIDAGGSLVAGWSAGGPGRRSPQRSPQRPRREAAAGSGLLQPLLEQGSELRGNAAEQGQPQLPERQQPAGGPAAADIRVGAATSSDTSGGGLPAQASLFENPSFLAASRASTEQGGGLGGRGLAQQESSMLSSVIDNPSFLSQSSDREQWAGGRYSTQEAAVPLPSLAEQQEEEPAGLLAPAVSAPLGEASWEAEAGAPVPGRPGEAPGLPGLRLQGGASSLADSFDAEAAAAARERAEAAAQQQQQPGEQGSLRGASAAAAPAAAAAAAGASGPEVLAESSRESLSGAAGAAGGSWRAPQPIGLILLHPDLSGCVAPKYARVLAHSRLGRRVLRQLLRTEMGELTNRRAWADPYRLGPELLALYRRPLHVQGWDRALIEVARAPCGIHSLERARLLAAVVDAGLPVLVATGEQDRLVPPSAVARIAERLGGAAPRLAVLPGCGHLSHEEAPAALVDFCQPFALDALAAAQQHG